MADTTTTFGFAAPDVRRIGAAVRAFEAGDDYGATPGRRPPISNQVITARLTGRDGTDRWVWAWAQVRRIDGEYETVPDGLTGTTTERPAYDPNERTDHAGGDIVHLRRTVELTSGEEEDDPDTQAGCWEIVSYAERPGALFVVNLSKTGGSDGSNVGEATWEYTVTSLAGEELLTSASPERARPLGTREYATKGYAYVEADGSIHLAEAWEVEGSGGCPSEE